ncbi:MAG: SpoIIE family protein phosphatase [Proteobacteria bacterium]|nr:SpoIIE family protein phosphatase [Burkholderiales bacterium]
MALAVSPAQRGADHLPTGALRRRLSVPNERAAVATASVWIRAVGAEAGLSETDLFRLDLCVTEALTNTFSYGGLDADSAHTEIECEAAEHVVRCTLRDAGVAFDPAAAELPALPSLLDHAARGGAGLRLVREFADACTYLREAERNVFSFTLQRHGSRASSRSNWVARGAERRALVERLKVLSRPAGVIGVGIADGSGDAVERDRRSGVERRALGFISQLRILQGAPYSALETLIADCPQRTLAAEQVWLAPGERSTDVAVVLTGRLRVHVESAETAPIYVVDVGHCAGEMQLLDGDPASAFVIADVDSTVLLIPGRMLRERLLSIPQVAANLLSILAGRIRRSDRLIAEQVRAAMELERLHRELKLAQEIQVSMLPVPPLFSELPQIDCVGFMRPAKEVGGDFYDAFALDANHVFVTIGDICGKGLPSALFMVRTLTTLWNETTRRRNPQRIVEHVNRHLCVNNDSGLFVSLFCGVYDLGTRCLQFVSAGHNPPLISIAGEPLHFLDAPRNLVAGIAPQANFRAGSIELRAGSLVILYTDGLTEAESVDQQWFGDERLLATIEHVRDEPLPELTSAVVRAVDEFAVDAVQADDLTLLAFRVNA